VTVLVADIKGCTESVCQELTGVEVLMFHNSRLNSILDSLLDEYNVLQVETTGDCYMVVAGGGLCGPTTISTGSSGNNEAGTLPVGAIYDLNLTTCQQQTLLALPRPWCSASRCCTALCGGVARR
jgi:hypothetical protein